MTDSGSPQASPQHCFMYRLIPPRPSFNSDMSEAEAEVMGRHVAYWQEHTARGAALVFGPVGDPTGVWGMAVLQVPEEECAHELGRADPAVTSGVASFEVWPMPATIVRSEAPLRPVGGPAQS